MNVRNFLMILFSFFAFSGICSAKSKKTWKVQWLRFAMQCKVSDKKGMKAKEDLLGKFEEQLKTIDEFKRDRENKVRAIKGEGFQRRFVPDALGAVYSQPELQNLYDFLSELRTFLSQNMYASWKEIIRENPLYSKLAGVAATGKSGFWRWMMFSTAVGGAADITDSLVSAV